MKFQVTQWLILLGWKLNLYISIFFLCEQVLTGFRKATSVWGSLELIYHR